MLRHVDDIDTLLGYQIVISFYNFESFSFPCNPHLLVSVSTDKCMTQKETLFEMFPDDSYSQYRNQTFYASLYHYFAFKHISI